MTKQPNDLKLKLDVLRYQLGKAKVNGNKIEYKRLKLEINRYKTMIETNVSLLRSAKDNKRQ